jgi:hypothetical protein
MEGTAQFDLRIDRGIFAAEVECKSISADAGRQIHRKDFCRFVEAISPALEAQRMRRSQEVLVITLDTRLSSNTSDQAALLAAARSILQDGTRTSAKGEGFELRRQDFKDVLAGAPLSDARAFDRACITAFGPNTHVAGGLTDDSGCLVVMRSKRDDDTSEPMLEAMRKAASQFSRERPAFIAIQEHGIEAADLMLPHLRRRAGILAYALYGHYAASHVSATYVMGFGAVVTRNGVVGTPAFSIPNPKPAFAVAPTDVPPLLVSIADEIYAAEIGAPLPAPNISYIPIELTGHADTKS